MGILASEHPKCMTEISGNDTILSRQLKQLVEVGIEEIIITTGAFDDVLVGYCLSLDLPIRFHFIKNPIYENTNYIYSIYCARDYLDSDILLLHGDLVFESEVLDKVLGSKNSCMAVSSTRVLPEKDFKAVIQNERIVKVGIEFFNEARGFGFIKDLAGVDKYFFHVNNVVGNISEGNIVTFDLERGVKGMNAVNICLEKKPVEN